MAERELTAAQEKALADAEADLGRAHDEARRKLAAAGFGGGPDPEPHLECLRCHCDGFISRPPGGGCGRPGCGHPFFSHNIPF